MFPVEVKEIRFSDPPIWLMELRTKQSFLLQSSRLLSAIKAVEDISGVVEAKNSAGNGAGGHPMGSPPPLPDPTIGGDPEPKPKPIQVNKTDGRVGLPVSARVPGTLLPLNGRPRRKAPFGRSGGVTDDAAAQRRKFPPGVQKGRERRRERTCVPDFADKREENQG